MPNWCGNKLTVTGPTERVQAFIADTSTEEESFVLEKVLPTPEHLLDNDHSPLGGGWYEWRVENWGSKWDVSEAEFDLAPGNPGSGMATASYVFDTAWSPISPAVETLASRYPSLDFVLSYDEPGNNFSGTLFCSEGVVVSHEVGESAWSDEYEEEEGSGDGDGET